MGDARGAAAAGHPAEVAAALRILEEGGNAVDAAIAGAFCAFVVEPNNAGPAGYGHLTAWLPGEGRSSPSTTARARRPRRAPISSRSWGRIRRGATTGPPSRLARNEFGALAIGVPGAVAGLCAAHERAGQAAAGRACRAGDRDRRARAPRRLAPRADDRRSGSRTSARSRPRRPSCCADGDPPRPATTGATASARHRRARRDAATHRARGRAGFGRRRSPLADAVVRAVAATGGILTRGRSRRLRPRVVEEQPAALSRRARRDRGGRRRPRAARHPRPRPTSTGSRPAPPTSCTAGRGLRARVRRRADVGRRSGRRPGGSQRLRSARVGGRARGGDPHRSRGGAPIAPGRSTARAAVPGVGGTAGTTQVAVADGEGGMAVVITTIGQDFGCSSTSRSSGVPQHARWRTSTRGRAAPTRSRPAACRSSPSPPRSRCATGAR